MVTDTHQTHTHTHKMTTVTCVAHTCQGVMIIYHIFVHDNTSNDKECMME